MLVFNNNAIIGELRKEFASLEESTAETWKEKCKVFSTIRATLGVLESDGLDKPSQCREMFDAFAEFKTSIVGFLKESRSVVLNQVVACVVKIYELVLNLELMRHTDELTSSDLLPRDSSNKENKMDESSSSSCLVLSKAQDKRGLLMFLLAHMMDACCTHLVPKYSHKTCVTACVKMIGMLLQQQPEANNPLSGLEVEGMLLEFLLTSRLDGGGTSASHSSARQLVYVRCFKEALLVTAKRLHQQLGRGETAHGANGLVETDGARLRLQHAMTAALTDASADVRNEARGCLVLLRCVFPGHQQQMQTVTQLLLDGLPESMQELVRDTSSTYMVQFPLLMKRLFVPFERCTDLSSQVVAATPTTFEGSVEGEPRVREDEQEEESDVHTAVHNVLDSDTPRATMRFAQMLCDNESEEDGNTALDIFLSCMVSGPLQEKKYAARAETAMLANMDLRRESASVVQIKRSFYVMNLLSSTSIRSRAMMKIVFAEQLSKIVARLLQAFLPSTEANIYHVCNTLSGIVRRFPNAAGQALLAASDNDPSSFQCFLKCAALHPPVGSCLALFLTLVKLADFQRLVFVTHGLLSRVVREIALESKDHGTAVGAFDLCAAIVEMGETHPARSALLRATLSPEAGLLELLEDVADAIVSEERSWRAHSMVCLLKKTFCKADALRVAAVDAVCKQAMALCLADKTKQDETNRYISEADVVNESSASSQRKWDVVFDFQEQLQKMCESRFVAWMDNLCSGTISTVQFRVDMMSFVLQVLSTLDKGVVKLCNEVADRWVVVLGWAVEQENNIFLSCLHRVVSLWLVNHAKFRETLKIVFIESGGLELLLERVTVAPQLVTLNAFVTEWAVALFQVFCVERELCDEEDIKTWAPFLDNCSAWQSFVQSARIEEKLTEMAKNYRELADIKKHLQQEDNGELVANAD